MAGFTGKIQNHTQYVTQNTGDWDISQPPPRGS